jgi:SAM-dependent methyltransferase
MTPILIIIGFAILLSFAYAGLQGAPFVPTRKKDVKRFLKIADIKAGQKMYDLGCGDGRLICAAANAGANAEGLEISILPFILSHIRRFFSKESGKIKISYKNVWNTNLCTADLIYVWLMPEALPKLKTKFEKELKKGTKIITYVWPIEGWTPIIQDEVKGYPNLFLYKI